MRSAISSAAALALGAALTAVGGCGGSQAAASGAGQAGGPGDAPAGADEPAAPAAPADECAPLGQGRCKITSGCTWSDSEQVCQIDRATAVMP